MGRFYFGACFAGLSLVACAVNLRAGRETEIECQADAECPVDMRCAVSIGRCVAAVANNAPSVTVASIERSLDVAKVVVNVFDEESNDATLAAALIAGSQHIPLDLAETTYAAAPQGTEHSLLIDLASALGSKGYRGDLQVQLTPRDETGIGATVTSEPFQFGNDPPVLESVIAQGSGGVVQVTVVVTDSSGDPARVSGYEYSLDDFSTTVSVALDGNSFLDETTLAGLSTLGDSPSHVLTWNTAIAAPLVASALKVRAKVADRFGAESGWAVSPPFAIDNSPTLALAVAPASGRPLTAVTFNANVSDPNVPLSETLSLAFEYTTDPLDAPTQAWHSLAVAAPSSGLSALGALSYVWDALAEAQSTGHLPVRSIDTSDGAQPKEALLGYVAHLAIRGLATDSASLTSGRAAIGLGAVGNDPPVASIVGVSSDPRNDVAISVRIVDSSADPADLEVQFREGNTGPFRTAALVLSNVVQLASDPGGVTHLVLWASSTKPVVDPTKPQGVGAKIASHVELRVRARDRAGTVGGSKAYFGDWSAATTLPQVRNETPPRIDSIAFERLIDSDGSAPVAIRYRVIDDELDPVDVRFELSFDGGPFAPCPEYPSPLSEDTRGLASAPEPGIEHVFIWNPTADRVRGSNAVELRVSARDGIHPTTTTAQRLLARGAQSSFLAPNDQRYVEGPPPAHPISDARVFVTSADVTGDGIDDIVTAEDTGPTVQVHIGQGSAGVGNGTFSMELGQWHCAAPTGGPCAGPQPTAMKLADLSGDGKPDVVLANADGTISLMIGTGSAGLANDSFVTPSENYTLAPITAGLSGLVVKDFNNDGKPDVAVSTQDGDVAVFLGALSGGSSPTITLTLAALTHAAVDLNDLITSDVDRDGDPDLVAVSYTGSSVLILVNDLGAPSPALSLLSTIGVSGQMSPQTLAAVEINGDGVLDLAVAGSAAIVTLIGDPLPPFFTFNLDPNDGTKPLSQAIPGPQYRPSLHVADLNADGLDDLLATEDDLASVRKAVSVYFGRGQGLSQPQDLKGGLDRAQGAVTGFFNGDDLPDIAYVKDDQINFGLLHNQLMTLEAAHTLQGTLPDYSAERSTPVPGYFPGVYDHQLRAGDFNGDGIVDLAYGGPADLVTFQTDISILAGEGAAGVGSGGFAARIASFTNEGVGIFEVKDLNGDGMTDVVFSHNNGAELAIALSNGALPMTISSAHSLVAAPTSITIADVSNDGILDIVLTRIASSGLEIFLGQGSAGVGNGTFAASYVVGTTCPAGFPPPRPNVSLTGDFDGDGLTDIIYRCGGVFSSPTAYLLSSSDAFALPTELVGVNVWATAYAVDLNRDGLLDLVSAGGSAFGGDDVTVHLGQGALGVADGTFGPPVTYAGLAGVVSVGPVFIADVDLDGVLDLLAFTLNRAQILLMKGQSVQGVPTGTFAPAVPWQSSGLEPISLVVRDFNSDEVPDIAVMYNRTPVISRWYGQYQRHQAFSQAVKATGTTKVHTFGANVVEPDAGGFGSKLGAKSVVMRPVYAAAYSSDPDFWNALRRSPLALTHQLSAITDPWLLDGFLLTRRVPAPANVSALGPRLRLFDRFGPLLAGQAPARAGLSLASGRGLVVSVPLNGRFDHATLAAAIAGSKIHLYKQVRRLVRSDDVASDPLDDAAYLPRALDALGKPYDRIAYRDAWSELPMDDDASFSTGTSTGERFIVALAPLGARTLAATDVAEGEVQVLLDTPGIVQAFVVP